MCRSIKQLRPSQVNTSELPTEEEIRAATLQFVRKVSGYRKPSRANQLAFDHAVDEISTATEILLKALGTPVG